MVVIFGAQNCHFGGLVPPFWPWGLFWRLGAPWATLGAAGRTMGIQGRIFIDFGMVSEAHVVSFSGTEG